ncbi:class I SAM-dependent methyltransferase, partial [Aeromonas veronii]
GSLSRYSKSTVRRHRRVSHFEVEFAEFYQDISGVDLGCVDIVFCLEVFEHLPPDETNDALSKMYDLLKQEGVLIIGTPVEIGIPALYKGIFRMLRRYGEFDANIKNVWLSFIKRPPSKRPVAEIAPKFKFHFEHMGFDFRRLKKIISTRFLIRDVSTSPISWIGTWIMPEVYFVAEKNSNQKR